MQDTQSQFSKDLFYRWKQQQIEKVAERGANVASPAAEEEYNNTMIRQNLNAYICHKQLDLYAQCLSANGLLDTSNEKFEINTKNKMNEVRCRTTHMAYTDCMSSKANQETVLHAASMNPNCAIRRGDLSQCLEERREVETRTNEAQCMEPYRRLVRCGLNHLWNDYWRSLTNFGESEEFHLFEMSRSHKKKQEYLEFVTSDRTIGKLSAEAVDEISTGKKPSWQLADKE